MASRMPAFIVFTHPAAAGNTSYITFFSGMGGNTGLHFDPPSLSFRGFRVQQFKGLVPDISRPRIPPLRPSWELENFWVRTEMVSIPSSLPWQSWNPKGYHEIREGRGSPAAVPSHQRNRNFQGSLKGITGDADIVNTPRWMNSHGLRLSRKYHGDHRRNRPEP